MVDYIKESDEIFMQINLSKEDYLPHIYKALEYYQAFLKASKTKLSDEEQANLKRLFGLVKYQKLDFYSEQLTLGEKVVLFLALDKYREWIENDALVNENLINQLDKEFAKVTEKENKKKAQAEKPKLTDEQIIKLNLFQNKRIMLESEINSFDRRGIYQNIDAWFDKVFVRTKNNNKTHKATIIYKDYTINFIAKLGVNSEHIYRIKEIKKENSKKDGK